MWSYLIRQSIFDNYTVLNWWQTQVTCLTFLVVLSDVVAAMVCKTCKWQEFFWMISFIRQDAFFFFSLLGIKNHQAFLPLQKVVWRNKPSTGVKIQGFLCLPPEHIILVNYLKYFTLFKGQACISTRNGRVLQGAVICHGSHIQLLCNTDKSEGDVSWSSYKATL